MGHVYLADDTRLGRKVALKVLPNELAADEAARRRFVQEARTASALNHPHIVGLLDIGQDNGDDFIVMEFVEGETLRGMLERGPLEVKRAIDLVAQAASGLAAAHDAQIVHRDIKPENLIVTKGNHLKILDFGLAKLTEQRRVELSDDAVTAANRPALTRAGMIVGTAAYMSPEQAQSLEVDGRTDIFSLGAVLYELLTGGRAFSGKSTIDTLHAVINRDPVPAVDVNRGLPLEMMEVLAKALAKDPTERYRHAGDFELDLRRLKRGLESGTLPSVARAGTARAGFPWLGWAAIATAALVAVAIGLWALNRPTPAVSNAAEVAAALTPLTSDAGFEGEPTFSPDGETIAYVSDRTGNLEIFLKQVSGGPDVNISNNPADDFQPSFSPDGRQIVFVSTRAGASDRLFYGPNSPAKGGDIWVMPALGGNARRIAAPGNFPAWSPDGSHILYASGPWFGGRLRRVPASGGTPQDIPVTFANGFTPSHLVYPSYSSDGHWILFATPEEIAIVTAGGGEATIVARGQTPVWGQNSHTVIYSNGDVGKNLSLFSAPFDTASGRISGPPRGVTIGRGADQQPAASRDGKRIAFSAIAISTRIEVQPFDADAGRLTGTPVRLTNNHDLIDFFDISPDGRAALFELRRGPTVSIGRVDAAALPVQVTSDANYDDTHPLWSADGNTIAFSRRRSRQAEPFSLWLMAADGANPRQLIDRMGLNGLFTWMPDDRGLVHVGPGRQLFLLDSTTKTERRLTDEVGVMPIVTISSDGKWLVYQCVVGDTIDLHAVPSDGGPSRVVVQSPAQDYHPSISPSGRWLYYYPDHKNLYRVPGPSQGWRRAEPERITDWHLTSLAYVENPQLSRDGRHLAYSRGDITGDLWLVDLAKP